MRRAISSAWRSTSPARRARRLFVLGDLFDFWFAYAHAIPRRHLAVVRRLAELTEAGIGVTYFGGNHDFWAGRFLEQEVGATVHDEPAMVTVAGRKLALMHGDGEARGDTGYKLLKGLLRSGWAISAYRAIHPDLGIPFAHGYIGHPLYRTEAYVDRFGEHAALPGAESFCRTVATLSWNERIEAADVADVATAVRKVADAYRKEGA